MTQGSPLSVKSFIIPALALILPTLVVYGQTLGFDFISNWDDNLYVTGNHDILGLTAHNLVRVFSSSYVGNYAPIHLLSYMFDFQLAGMNPAWFHGVNVALHVANGLLFYLLVLRLTGKPFWGFVSAAFFLLHPVQVESVAWVTERKNLLAMFFSLAAFLSYIAYCREPAARRWRAYVFSLALLVLALLAKSIAVVVPCAFLCYDYLLEAPGNGRRVLVDKIPFFAAAALAACLTMVTQSAEMGGGSVDYFAGHLAEKSLTMLAVFTRYLKLLVWPSDLNIIYIFVTKKHFDAAALLAILLVLALAAAGSYLWRRDRTLFFGFALFFLGLLPVSQIAPIATLMNDRYLYFPMLGAAWMLGAGLSRLNDRFAGRVNPASVLLCTLLVPCLLLAHQRTGVWRDAISLWSDTSAKLPTLKDPLATLAEAYLNAGQRDKALASYQKVFSLPRKFSDLGVEQLALINTAQLQLQIGSPAAALPLLDTLSAKFPDYPEGFLTRGDYHTLSRQLPEAELAYRKALALDPRSPRALLALGNLCLATGRTGEASSFYLSCQQNGGNGPELQYALGCLAAQLGGQDKALRHLEQALRLGYRNRDSLTGNPALASLKGLPAFERLLAGYFPERP